MGEHHHHGEGSARGRLAAVFVLIAGFMVVEFAAAVLTRSLALMVDAAHMLTDAVGLGVALLAATLALKPATPAKTWGYQRAEVLAAAFQALVLLAVGLYVVVEAVLRFFHPPQVHSGPMLWVGVAGLLVNAVGLWILRGGQQGRNTRNLNLRAASLEVLNDAVGSVAVIAASLVIAWTGFVQADAIASLLIGALIIPRTIRLLLDSASVLMGNAPKDLDMQQVRAHLEKLDGVLAVHDLHASLISSAVPELSAHIVVEDRVFFDGRARELLVHMQRCVAEHFPLSIRHSTFQLEPQDHESVEGMRH